MDVRELEDQAQPVDQPVDQAPPLPLDFHEAQAEQASTDGQHLTPEQRSYLDSPALLTKPCPFCSHEFLSTSTRSAHIKRSHQREWETERVKVGPGNRVQWHEVAESHNRHGQPMTAQQIASIAPSRRPGPTRGKPGPKPKKGSRPKAQSQPRPKPSSPSPLNSLTRQTLALQQINEALSPLTPNEVDRVLVFVQDSHGLFAFKGGGNRPL